MVLGRGGEERRKRGLTGRRDAFWAFLSVSGAFISSLAGAGDLCGEGPSILTLPFAGASFERQESIVGLLFNNFRAGARTQKISAENLSHCLDVASKLLFPNFQSSNNEQKPGN